MTIILQHQFWDLTVNEQGFEVGLSFGGITERLSIPFEAINGFFDPSVQFGLQFEEVTEGESQQTPANEQDKAQELKGQELEGARRSAERRLRTSRAKTKRFSASPTAIVAPNSAPKPTPVTPVAGETEAGQANRRRRSGPPRSFPQEVMAKKPGKAGARVRGKTRTESDAFGPLEIPADKLWGAQTERSLHNFRIGTERMPIAIVHALGLIKRAAAEVNRDLGTPRLPGAPEPSSRWRRISPTANWTSIFRCWCGRPAPAPRRNMNVNEVIANIANVALGGELGSKKPVHPNDHVNMSQSSNDSIPSAMHIAAAMRDFAASAAGADADA